MIQLSPGFVAPKAKDTEFKAVVTANKEKSTAELKDENEKLTKRVAYLEAEIAKLQAKLAN